jgi:hypothetical protein
MAIFPSIHIEGELATQTVTISPINFLGNWTKMGALIFGSVLKTEGCSLKYTTRTS